MRILLDESPQPLVPEPLQVLEGVGPGQILHVRIRKTVR